ncbi:MAG: hypothetical protein EXR12_16170 [Rhodospirillaceae bacterium]|nr:hypothetical protein [Rhodospirillaceae bacterium]
MDIAEFDSDMAAAVASVVVRKTTGGRRVRLRSKPPALALLGRHLRLWRTRAEHPLAGLAEDIAEIRKRVM